MKLENIYCAKFLERKNRFVWKWILNNQEVLFHIADTWRLKELLFNQNEILLQKLDWPRKYKYRLISAKWLQWKFILLNSLLHSKLVREYLVLKNIEFKPEVVYNDSKLDFLVDNKIYVEVKGCSLIQKINNEFVWMFPDAPTKRWQKHLKELINLIKNWKQAQIWFLLTNNVSFFTPNYKTDPVFSNLFYQFVNLWWSVKFLYANLNYKKSIVDIFLTEKNVALLKDI